MSEIVLKQFEMARGWTIEVSESITREVADVKPRGFNNTIHWQIGHILTASEYFLIELPSEVNHLPPNYRELFGADTKPDDWQGKVPAVDQLVTQLKEQLVRMRQISPDQFNQNLANPRHGFKTLGDSAAFSVLHEGLHVGKIEEMKRVIVHSGVI